MRRILWPREHGAYAQLAFPLLSGLILGGVTPAGGALVLAVVSFFLCYEAAAVRLGVRGVRLQREEGAAARRQLRLLLPAGVTLGAAAVIAAPPAARLLLVVPLALAAVLIPLVPAKRVKTLAGETVVLAALASMHLPIAAAGGTGGLRLWGPALIWFTGYFLATLAVHAIKARQKQRDRWLRVAAAGSALAVAALCGAIALLLPGLRAFGLVLIVPVLAVVAVNAARVQARSLKRVGWTLVAADLATLALFTLL